jgi:hypothetical protein
MLLVVLGGCSSKNASGSRNDGGGGGSGPPVVPSCRNSLECAAGKICDPSISQCVDCAATTDCPPSNDCVARKCVPYVTCMSSLACPTGQVCNTAIQRCVDCITDADCVDMTKTCVANACRIKCASDKVCVPLGMLCDVGSGSCVSCLVASDCATGQICQGGACQTAVCQPGKTTCVLNAVTACNATGDGYTGPGTACDPRSCTVTAAGASCTDLSPGSGGASGSGGAGGSTGGGNPDPNAYLDVQLIASCGSQDNEGYGGFWWSAADGDGIIMPAPNAGFPASAFVTGADAYMGTSLHFSGTVMTGHALFGVNINVGATFFNASAYDGMSFWARAPVPAMVRVGVGQQNTDSNCSVDAGTCYDHPSLTVQVGTTWSRIVVPFSLLVPENGPNPNVPTTPDAIKHFQWGMPPAGAFSVFVDEIYFIKHK